MPQHLWWLASILALLSLSGLSLVTAVRLTLTMRESFLPTTLIAMLALYSASLAGLLLQMTIIVSLAGLISLVLLIFHPRWRAQIAEISDLRPFFWIITGFGFLTVLWLRNFRLIGYDEFTHWGLMAQYLTDRHSLPTADSHIVFMQYAPGTALIQYFFAWLAQGAEQAVLFGHLTLFFACLLFLTSSASKLVSILAVMAWSVLATYLLRYDLSFIFVDAMLGGLLAAALLCAIKFALIGTNTASFKTVWLMVPIVAYLPLVKHVGLVLGLSAIFVLAIGLIQQRFEEQRVTASLSYPSMISRCILPLAGLAFAYLSWKFHYQSLGITDSYRQVVTFQNAIDFFIRPTDLTHLAVWQTFFKRMTSSVGIVTVVLVIWSIVLVLSSSQHIRAFLTVTLSGVALGYVGYLALLLISYAFFFEGDERIHLASFERYARSYQLGWILLLVAIPTLNILRKTKTTGQSSERLWASVALGAGCIGLVVHPLSRSSLFEREHIYSEARTKRTEIATLANKIKGNVLPTEKVYFFDATGDGLAWYMLRYELRDQWEIATCWSAPARMSDGSLGEPNVLCEKDLSKVLNGYDYFVLFSSSPSVANVNQQLTNQVELKEGLIYKVDKTSGAISLSAVDTP